MQLPQEGSVCAGARREVEWAERWQGGLLPPCMNVDPPFVSGGAPFARKAPVVEWNEISVARQALWMKGKALVYG